MIWEGLKVVRAIKVLDNWTFFKCLGRRNVSPRGLCEMSTVYSLLFFLFPFLSLSNLTSIREVKGWKAIGFKSLLGTLGCQGRRPPDLHCLWCLENNANKGRVLLLNAGMPSSLAKAQAVPGKHPRKQSPLSKSARKGWRRPLTFRKVSGSPNRKPKDHAL